MQIGCGLCVQLVLRSPRWWLRGSFGAPASRHRTAGLCDRVQSLNGHYSSSGSCFYPHRYTLDVIKYMRVEI